MARHQAFLPEMLRDQGWAAAQTPSPTAEAPGSTSRTVWTFLVGFDPPARLTEALHGPASSAVRHPPRRGSRPTCQALAVLRLLLALPPRPREVSTYSGLQAVRRTQLQGSLGLDSDPAGGAATVAPLRAPGTCPCRLDDALRVARRQSTLRTVCGTPVVWDGRPSCRVGRG